MTIKNKIFFLLFYFVFLFASTLTAQSEKFHRIISLVPSHTELLFELGFGDHLKGITNYCNYPPETQKIEQVGDLELDIEKIMILQPTLLLDLNSMHRKYAMLFAQLGLNYVDIKISNLKEIASAARQISRILGNPAKGEAFAENWLEQLAQIKQNHPTTAPKVYLEIWDTPMQAAGPNSYMGSLLAAAGAENIIEPGAAYPVVNSEQIINANPDFILLSYPLQGIEGVISRPGWNTLNAVKNSRVTALEQDLFVRPGPRNIKAIKILQRLFSDFK
jgi:iron complex transport system substrate-binding protein